MSLTVHELVHAIYGVVRLARFDARGMDYIDRTPDGALRSFWAAAVVLPAYLLLIAVRDGASLAEVPLGHVLLVQSIAYVVGWAAFPVIMHPVTHLIDRKNAYPGMVAAYNWSAVVQVAIQLPLVLLMATGLLSDEMEMNLALAVLAIVMVYIWFILRTALNIDKMTAAGLVLIEITTTALISGYADHLIALGTSAAE